MNKKIKNFLLLVLLLFAVQFVYAQALEVLKDETIPANSNFSSAS